MCWETEQNKTKHGPNLYGLLQNVLELKIRKRTQASSSGQDADGGALHKLGLSFSILSSRRCGQITPSF
jgi:hypothetical protein